MLKNSRILYQILSIAAVMGIFAIGMGSLFLRNDLISSDIKAELAITEQRFLAVQDIRYQFVTARRIEKQFLLSHQTEDYIAFKRVTDNLIKLVTQIKPPQDIADNAQKTSAPPEEVTDVEVESEYDKLLYQVKRYSFHVQQVYQDWQRLGETEKQGLRASLKDIMAQISSHLDRMGINALSLAFYQLHTDLFEPDTGSYETKTDQLYDQIDLIYSRLPDMGLSEDNKQKTVDLLEKYLEFCEQVLVQKQRIEHDSQDITDVFNEAFPLFLSIEEQTKLENQLLSSSLEEHSSLFLSIVTIILPSLVIMVTILSIIVARNIGQPIMTLTNNMEALAKGDLSSSARIPAFKNEIGKMVSAVSVFRQNAMEKQALEAQKLKFQKKAAQDKIRALSQMAETIEKEMQIAVGQISDLTGAMSSSSTRISETTGDVSQRSVTVLESAETVQGKIDNVSQSATQLLQSIEHINTQIRSSFDTIHQSVQIGINAQNVIAQLSDSVSKIDDITLLIGSVAEKTNLLSLNATIEAARAGEAGKGFSVVANEVKNLAKQTTDSTHLITEQIQEIKSFTRDAVTSVQEMHSQIQGVDKITEEISQAIGRQQDATDIISVNVQDVAVATKMMTENLQNVTEQADKAEDISSDFQRKSQDVHNNVKKLNNQVIEIVQSSTNIISQI